MLVTITTTVIQSGKTHFDAIVTAQSPYGQTVYNLFAVTRKGIQRRCEIQREKIEELFSRYGNLVEYTQCTL